MTGVLVGRITPGYGANHHATGTYRFDSSWSNTPPSAAWGPTVDDIVPKWSNVPREPPTWLRESSQGAVEFHRVDARGWPMLSLFSVVRWTQVNGVAETVPLGPALPDWYD